MPHTQGSTGQHLYQTTGFIQLRVALPWREDLHPETRHEGKGGKHPHKDMGLRPAKKSI